MPNELENIYAKVNSTFNADATKDPQGTRRAFANSIQAIVTRIEELSKRDRIGKRKSIDEAEKQNLLSLYNEAMRCAEKAYEHANHMTVSLIMDIKNLLVRDQRILSTLKAEEKLTIDDVLDRARTDTVVITEDQLETAGGSLSSRIPLTITNENGEKISGFFTKESKVDAGERFIKLFEEIGKQNAQYGNFLMHYYNTLLPTARKKGYRGREALYFINELKRKSADLGKRKDIKKPLPTDTKDLHIMTLEALYKDGTADKNYEIKNEKDPKSMFAMLSKGFRSIAAQVGFYYNQLNGYDGLTIDKRNTAMTKVAELLGVPNLIAHSRNMDLIIDGKKVRGTFMKDATGIDLTRMPQKHPALKVSAKEQSGAGFKDIADIQVLDYICGNLDRHAANMLYQFDKNGMFIGVQGIDNDASFGTNFDKKGKGHNRMAGPAEMPFITQSMANKIKNLKSAELKYALEGNGLTPGQIEVACARLNLMKSFIKNKKGPAIIKDEEFKNKKLSYFTEIAKEHTDIETGTFWAVTRKLSALKKEVEYNKQIQHTNAEEVKLSDKSITKTINKLADLSSQLNLFAEMPGMKALLEEDAQKTLEKVKANLALSVKCSREFQRNPNSSLAAVRAYSSAKNAVNGMARIIDHLNKIPPEDPRANTVIPNKTVFNQIKNDLTIQLPVLNEAVTAQNRKVEKSIDANASGIEAAMAKINKMNTYQTNIYKTDEENPNRLIMVKNSAGRRVPAIKDVIKNDDDAKQLGNTIKELNKLMEDNGPDDPSNSTGQVFIRDALRVLKNNPQWIKSSGLKQADFDACKENMLKGLAASNEAQSKKDDANQLVNSVMQI